MDTKSGIKGKTTVRRFHLNGGGTLGCRSGVLQKTAVALQEEVEPESTSAEVQPNVMLCWPIT